DTALGMALILRTANARGNNRSTIVIGKLRIAAVQDCIQTGVFQHTGTEIVWDRQPGYAAEILIGMHMAEQPVFRFHVIAEFGIDIAAAGKNSDKQVRRNYSPGNGVFDRQCPASPV